MSAKSQKKQSKEKKKANNRTVSDIINKIEDTQKIVDKKLLELSSICLGKDCKYKG